MLPLISLLLPLGLAATPDPPDLEGAASWKGAAVQLQIEGGPGEHLSPEGPAQVTVHAGARRLELSVVGRALSAGVALPRLDGPLQIAVEAVVCEDGGTQCRPQQTDFAAVTLEGRRGAVALARALDPAGAPEPRPDAAPPGSLSEAMAAAAARDKLVLIDFGAVWCPPCNLLAAEVLHAADPPAVLDDFVLVEVDVDAEASWDAKSRYDVGGYPTLLIAQADGTEIDRLVGYPGREAVAGWLEAARGLPPLGAVPAADTLSPAQQVALAERLQIAGRPEEAEEMLAAAEGADTDPAALDRARLLIRDDPAAAVAWLGRTTWLHDAFGNALKLADDHPEVAAALDAALARLLVDADPFTGADLLYVAATRAPEEAATTLYGAGASLLRSGLSGDPALDRGHWSFLATLQLRAGQGPTAVATLRAAAAAYPDEFTFHYALARTLLRLERAEDALEASAAALEHSYGDNRLRAAQLRAEALAAHGDEAAAVALIDETLAAARRPDADTRVRTPRYLRALEETRARIAGAPQP